jgi:hypothetical protein
MGERICAWCEKHLGYKAEMKEGEVTHGICLECMLDMFPVPHIDEQLIIECKQSGISPHELSQTTQGYFGA